MSMNWNQLLSPTRLGNRPPKIEQGRSPFHSDHDKIIFSGAFRRLAKKAQVHPLAQDDHIHNRLTHSLEVACIGRSLGILVGQQLKQMGKLPDLIHATDIGAIIQSTCLAHDIGTPPFGHTGEEAIRSCFCNDGAKFLKGLAAEEASDLQTFEGNAQGLRVLTSVENHLNQGGMRLTHATLASFIKYPWTSLPAIEGNRPKSSKFGVYQSELDIFHEIATAVGLQPLNGSAWFSRHPLVYLMEAADDFCYAILDLEDGLKMDIVKWHEIYEIVRPIIAPKDIPGLEKELNQVSDQRKVPLLRGKVIQAYVDAAAKAFIEHENEYLQGDTSSLIDRCDKPVRISVYEAKDLAKAKIFNHSRKVELEIGAYNVISTLIHVMCEAALAWHHDPKNVSFRSKRVLDLIGESTFDPRIIENREHSSKYLTIIRVIDFISGMTDNYAIFLAKQFNGMGESR